MRLCLPCSEPEHVQCPCTAVTVHTCPCCRDTIANSIADDR